MVSKSVIPVALVALVALPMACAADDSSTDRARAAALGACQTDCDQQRQGCAELQLEECYALCDYVLPGIESVSGCLELAKDKWSCESEVAWICATDTRVVGALVDPESCRAERDAYAAAGCSGG